MKSAIHADEIITNEARRFGSATVYYPAILKRADGTEAGMLFTAADLERAVARGKSNPEDIELARMHRSDRIFGYLVAGCGVLAAALVVALVSAVVL